MRDSENFQVWQEFLTKIWIKLLLWVSINLRVAPMVAKTPHIKNAS